MPVGLNSAGELVGGPGFKAENREPLTDEQRQQFAAQVNRALDAYPPSQQKIKDREELWQLYLAILPLHPVPDVAMEQAKLFHARWKAETAPDAIETDRDGL